MTNSQEPVVNTAVALVEIDAAIGDLQMTLDTNLPWLTHNYARAYRHFKKGEKDMYVPEVYCGIQNGQYKYYRPTPDNDKSAMCFFVVGKEEPYKKFERHQHNYLKHRVGIVFSANLNIINNGLLTTEIFTQHLIRDVRAVLTRKMLGKFYKVDIISVPQEFRDVFAEFDLSEHDNYIKAPQAIFRFNIDVIYQESCPDVAYSACAILTQNISESEILTCLLPTLDFSEIDTFNALTVQQKVDIENQLGGCDDAGETFQGNPVAPIPSGGLKAVTLKNSANNPVGSIITNTSTELELLSPDANVTAVNSNNEPLANGLFASGAPGNLLIPDVEIIVNGASQGNKKVTSPIIITPNQIIYIRPKNSVVNTTYLVGDYGWRQINHPDTYVPPAFGIPALLDPTNPNKLLYNNAFGHKWRFTGINGGYYDVDTLQYKLADGTVSTEAVTFGAGVNGYRIDHHTGIAHKWTANAAMTFSAMVTAVHSLSCAGFTDFEIGSLEEFNTIRMFTLQPNPLFPDEAYMRPLSPYNQSIKLCNNGPAAPTTTTCQYASGSIVLNRAIGVIDGWIPFRYHY